MSLSLPASKPVSFTFPHTRKIDSERIIACMKAPDSPANAAIIQNFRDKLHHVLSVVTHIEDMSALPAKVAEIASDVFPVKRATGQVPKPHHADTRHH